MTQFDCETERVNGEPVCVRVSDVQPEPIHWLWNERIALGKVTMWAGNPGLGKSMATLDLAARVSTGTPWPDSPSIPQARRGVVLLSAEDDVADTIRPRLDAARADVSNIVVLQGVKQRNPDSGEVTAAMFNLSKDIHALESAIAQVEDCGLVIIDPVSAYLGKVDSNKNAELRAVLGPLASLASDSRVAILCVSHLNKSAGSAAVYRVMGSLAFVAAARAAWCTVEDRRNPARRLVLPIKNNLAADTSGMAYTIRDVGGTGVIAWEPDPISGTSVDEALAPDEDGEASAMDEAIEWLREALRHGPQPAKTLLADARENGIAEKTLRRAGKRLGIKPYKIETRWEWKLPAEDGQDGQRGHLGQDDHLDDETAPMTSQGGFQDGQHDRDCNGLTEPGSTLQGDELPADLLPFALPEDTGSIGHRVHLARVRRAAAKGTV